MLLRRAVGKNAPKHAVRSRTVPLLFAGGLTAAFLAADMGVGAGAASAATATDFARLRQCESSGNYSINTGNGYYGAYQFDVSTWRGLGYSGMPNRASKATQDAAARKLQSQRGWSPWPACSRKLGLSSSGSTASRTTVDRASRTRTLLTTGVPRFNGHVLSTADAGSKRADVTTWQRRMAARGWRIGVDGHFGPQSAGVARKFAAEKGLHPRRSGTVDAAVWRAAWTARVS